MNGLRLSLVCVLLPMLAMAQPPAPVVTVADDDPVLLQLEGLAVLPWLLHDPFTADTATLNIHGFTSEVVPVYDATVYANRLKDLDARTPIGLTYNATVQSYIDMYAVRKREQTSRMLGLAQLYFPVFEEALDRHGLPMELKYLAVVESALNPAARSRVGATGLWQFMVGTGKLYDLEVDSYIDERHDIYQSTDAACRYLKDLYAIYGNWELALASYNCGPGNVNKAIRRSGGKRDYWGAYNYLPRETRGYVPAFIAVNYIMNHAAEHNLYPVVPTYCAYEMDTVQVCYRVTLEQIAAATGTSADALKELNPTYKQGVVPLLDRPSTLYLPRDIVASFLAQEDSLRVAGMRPEPVAAVVASAPAVVNTTTHTVRSGESLGLIADRNRVTVAQLKTWNGLRSDRIYPGQKLKIQKPASASTQRTSDSAPVVQPDGKPIDYIYYTVQPGDTLWDIARKYPGVSVDDIKRMNSGLDGENLSPGKKLKISVQKG